MSSWFTHVSLLRGWAPYTVDAVAFATLVGGVAWWRRPPWHWVGIAAVALLGLGGQKNGQCIVMLGEDGDNGKSTIIDMMLNGMPPGSHCSLPPRKWTNDRDLVLLVGGSTKMPQVSERLKQEFGKEPQVHDPDQAVAKGAAVYGQKLAIGLRRELDHVAAAGHRDKLHHAR